jgi:hypothetical protein
MHKQNASFLNLMKVFPWKEYRKHYIASKVSPVSLELTRSLTQILVNWLTVESYVKPNKSCVVPDKLKPERINCGAYPHAFQQNTSRRDTPAKVGLCIQFGFDVEMLEVHLNELYDVIDKFFIIEWTQAHNARTKKKSLLYEKIKDQERFQKFSSKIVHFILDDESTSEIDNSGNKHLFKREFYQEKRRWEKFSAWNKAEKFFSDDDIIGFGDADEIASRETVQLVKHCHLKKRKTLDVGLWFPYGKFDMAWKADFNVGGREYTLGDPTFWLLGEAKKSSSTPTRLRGSSPNYLIGGVHMTHHGYLPFLMLKFFTCTECGIGDILNIVDLMIQNVHTNNSLRVPEVEFSKMYIDKKRWVPLKSVDEKQRKEITYIPWFVNCNRDMYPTWFYGHDTRLD